MGKKEFQKLPRLIWQRVKRLRRRATLPEIVLGKALEELALRHRFQWAMRFGAKWYILDYYIPSLRICLEADGSSHRKSVAIKYDAIRDRNLRDVGIETVRIDNELLHNVMQTIHLVRDGIKRVRRIL